jgi:hypothetical protein
VGLDLNLPVDTSVARVDCDLTKDSASATAAWLTTVGWVPRLLAWVFPARFIAGFTSAVRKTWSSAIAVLGVKTVQPGWPDFGGMTRSCGCGT